MKHNKFINNFVSIMNDKLIVVRDYKNKHRFKEKITYFY